MEHAEEVKLNAVVREYLSHCRYSAALQAFDAECLNKGTAVDSHEQDTLDQLRTVHLMSDFMTNMDEGNYAEFFSMWNQHIPAGIRDTDPTCLKLEFYLNIFFAVQPLHPRYQMLELSPEVTLPRFRGFLENKGASLSKTTEFLPFYALPFVPEPEQHPSFSILFSNEWVPDLKARLETFLGPTLAATKKPKLYYLGKNPAGSAPNEEYIEAIHQQIAECEEREIEYIDRHNKLQREYHTLVGVAAELVEALEGCLRGKMVTPTYLREVAARLNILGSRTTESLATVRPERDARGAAGGRPPQQTTLCKLDFEKVRRDLQSLTARNKAVLLQALRWRLTHAKPGQQRRSVVDSFIRNDVLGITFPKVLALLDAPSDVVREYFTRLYNCMASLSRCRGYMMEHDHLIERLYERLVGEESDTAVRQNVLGVLQKLSLRRRAQSKMISLGAIDWIVAQLKDLPQLSEYSIEYTVALMMNLCLRTAGKLECVASPKEKLDVLVGLLDNENTQVRTYVHGTLYSLLSLPSVRRVAQSMGLDEVLSRNMKSSEPALARQLEYIVQQLHSTDETEIDPGYESDDGDDADDDDPEADDGEDLMTADAGEGESVSEAKDRSGENLLQTEYSVDRPPTRTRTAKREPAAQQEDMPSRPVTPGSRRGTRTATIVDERPRTSASGERPDSHGSRHSSARSKRAPSARSERPPSSRPTTGPGGGAHTRPVTGARGVAHSQRSERPRTGGGGAGAAQEGDEDEEFVKPPTPLDPQAAAVLSQALGERRVAAATQKVAPPSDKALEALKQKGKGDQDLQAALDEHEAAFSTRVRVPRTPVGLQQ